MVLKVTKLDDFLNLIKNGTWHSLTQLSRKISLPLNQLAEISKSLDEKGFIKYRERSQIVKINPEWSLDREEEGGGQKPMVGTVIIPPQQSIRIQNVHITNVTGLDVELWIKVCEELMEVAISKIEHL